MTQQVVVKKYVQRPDQSSHPVKVGSEAKNPLPIKIQGMNFMDLMGLSWIFVDEGEGKINDVSL